MVIDNESDIVAEKNIFRKLWEIINRYWIHGVISSLIATLIFHYSKGIWSIVRSAVEWIWGLITYRIALPIWALVLLALFVIHITVKYIKVKETLSSLSSNRPELYTEDKSYGVVWRWTWGNDGLENFRYCCPKCGALLICMESQNNSEHFLQCNGCEFVTNKTIGSCDRLVSNVKNQIMQKLFQKLYQKLKEYKDNVVDKG